MVANILRGLAEAGRTREQAWSTARKKVSEVMLLFRRNLGFFLSPSTPIHRRLASQHARRATRGECLEPATPPPRTLMNCLPDMRLSVAGKRAQKPRCGCCRSCNRVRHGKVVCRALLGRHVRRDEAWASVRTVRVNQSIDDPRFLQLNDRSSELPFCCKRGHSAILPSHTNSFPVLAAPAARGAC